MSVVEGVLRERGRLQVPKGQVGAGVQAARERRIAWRQKNDCLSNFLSLVFPAELLDKM